MFGSREGTFMANADASFGENPRLTRVLFLADHEWFRMCRALGLSPREEEITRLVLAAHNEDMIAAALVISIHTVHAHMERIYRKLRVHSRTELVIKIFETYVCQIKAGCKHDVGT
jgi:DNA-binding CsgD family transcriptional regulator